ncbi:hypothetical protein WJT74_08645 [Sphingomicrobium sp. XHP0239]|uniref:hypothetical protein n=1 Tax=Sphingomicrobium maritimum TaxID=3133972 RepID=UPI0031CC4488
MSHKSLKMLGTVGAIAASAAFAATPAQAQVYDRGNAAERIIGGILNGVLNGGRSYDYGRYPQGNYGYGNYGINERQAVDRCARQVEYRLDREYDRRDNRRYNRYDNYRRYDHGARVTGVTNVQRTRRGLTVYGVASTGYQQAYRGRNVQAVSDLRWNCDIDRNGRIRDTDVDRVSRNYNDRNRYYRY